MTDYYAVLGVQPDAKIDLIKQQYRKLAKESHPDLHPGDKAAEARFKEVALAWETLGNADKRAKYDREREKEGAAGRKRPSGRTAPVADVDIGELIRKYDSYFGKVVTPKEGQKQEANPLDASDLFEKYMGIKRK